MILNWIRRELPSRFAELYESLREPDDVLEVDVGIDHPVRHKKRIFETLCKVNRRRLAIGQRIVLRKIQNFRGITLIVVRPVGYAPERGSRAEMLRLSEQSHQGYEPSVAAPVDPDPFRTDVVSAVQVTRCVNLIL